MLAIGARNPYLQTAGIKKQQEVNRVKTQQPQSSGLIKSGGSKASPSSSSPTTALEIMAMANLMNNNNVPAQMRNPALESLNAQVNQSLTAEQSKVSNLSTKLSDSKSKLSEVKDLLSSSDTSSDQSEIYQLIASALQAEVKAFEELLSKAKYAVSELSGLASYGVNQVVGESSKSADLLEMLSRSNSEYSSEASTKLIHMSSESADATKKLGGLVQSGKLSLKKASIDAKDKDPQKTAEGLDNLYRNTNLSKEDRLTVTQVLTNIATENPLNAAGSAAASGLENIFKKDSGAVARNAAVGLRIAAIAGNERATDGLINVATSPVAGKEKNLEAIMQLTKVAKSGAGQSQKATDAITKMAQNPNFAGKVKEALVDSLGEIAYNGGNNGEKALDSLANIAEDDKSPHQKQAFNNILKQKTGNALGNSQVVRAFASISESHRADSKLKKQSTQKLGEAAMFGNQATAGKAQNSLVNVFTNPANKAAPEAGNQLKKIGFGNISKPDQAKIRHQMNNNTENKGNAHFKTKSASNPFNDDNFKDFKSPLVKAVNM